MGEANERPGCLSDITSDSSETKVSGFILKTLNHSPTPIVPRDKQKRGDDGKLEKGYEEELVIPVTRKKKERLPCVKNDVFCTAVSYVR